MTEQLSTSDANASRDSFLSVFPSIILPMFLVVLDQTIIAAALPEIAASFGHVQYISVFCRLKDFRRVATRYDKLARNYRHYGAVAKGSQFRLMVRIR